MVAIYINTAGKGTDASGQKQLLMSYAQKYDIAIDSIFTEEGWQAGVLAKLSRGTSVLVADVSTFGSRYEDILVSVSLAAKRGLRLYTVKENLRIDTMFPLSFEESAGICLQLYKGILSIRNKGIQDNLLQQGRKLGRPFSGRKGSSVLDNQEELVRALLRAGMNKIQIAERLGCGRTSLYLFIKRKGLDVMEKGRPTPVHEEMLRQTAGGILQTSGSGE